MSSSQQRHYGTGFTREHQATHAIRAELQRLQASVTSLARKYGINEKTVVKWRHGQPVEDMPVGPKERRSSILSPMEEAAIVALRVQGCLPLDDIYIALKDVIAHLSRSSLPVSIAELQSLPPSAS